MANTTGSNLFDLLVTRDLDPELLDSAGKPVSDPNEAELFNFDWKVDGTNYGTVVILLGTDNELEVYYGDNLGRTMETEHKKQWYDFLSHIKNFATRNLLTFELNNINRLKYTMQGMSAIREGLFEGYYGRRDISYSDQPKQTRIMIKHNRSLGEGEARYRAIESIYVETADGERFRVPGRSLSHGRMLARHVAEGGTPYDAFGQHITEMVNEINTLARFLRASRDRRFEGEAAGMREAAVRHYSALKSKAKRMISQRGYHEARSEFDPLAITEPEALVDDIRDLFVQQTLDQRIEEALPVLAKLRGSDMREAAEFERWAHDITESTWAIPDTEETKEKLRTLMAQPLPAGPDAVNATEQLYDVFGDDELFDRIGQAAETDPDVDVRPLIQARLKELDITLDVDTDTAPQEPLPDAKVGEDLDTDGVMMTRPSNMSSESIERLRRLALY